MLHLQKQYAVHPLLFVTETVYVPGVLTTKVLVVAPVLHTYVLPVCTPAVVGANVSVAPQAKDGLGFAKVAVSPFEVIIVVSYVRFAPSATVR
jgi:hypothetical protein